MSDDSSERPLFPTTAPEAMGDTDIARALFRDVFDRLAPIVEVDEAELEAPTPCADFDVAALRAHALGWLDFFAVALSDPEGVDRPDPTEFELGASAPSELVRRAAERFDRALVDGVADRVVTMSEARMAGDGVLAMALGEYIVHAWDLAVATGRAYDPPEAAVVVADEFLRSMVAPQFRGPDSGFFDAEVAVPHEADAFDRLLGFAGRDPSWTPG